MILPVNQRSQKALDKLTTNPDPRYTVNGNTCTVTDTTGGFRACSVDNAVARNMGAWASYATGHAPESRAILCRLHDASRACFG